MRALYALAFGAAVTFALPNAVTPSKRCITITSNGHTYSVTEGRTIEFAHNQEQQTSNNQASSSGYSSSWSTASSWSSAWTTSSAWVSDAGAVAAQITHPAATSTVSAGGPVSMTSPTPSGPSSTTTGQSTNTGTYALSLTFPGHSILRQIASPGHVAPSPMACAGNGTCTGVITGTIGSGLSLQLDIYGSALQDWTSYAPIARYNMSCPAQSAKGNFSYAFSMTASGSAAFNQLGSSSAALTYSSVPIPFAWSISLPNEVWAADWSDHTTGLRKDVQYGQADANFVAAGGKQTILVAEITSTQSAGAWQTAAPASYQLCTASASGSRAVTAIPSFAFNTASPWISPTSANGVVINCSPTTPPVSSTTSGSSTGVKAWCTGMITSVSGSTAVWQSIG